jgi:hypothetical protein
MIQTKIGKKEEAFGTRDSRFFALLRPRMTLSLFFVNFKAQLFFGSQFKTGSHIKLSPANIIKIATITSKIAFTCKFILKISQTKPSQNHKIQKAKILQV